MLLDQQDDVAAQVPLVPEVRPGSRPVRTADLSQPFSHHMTVGQEFVRFYPVPVTQPVFQEPGAVWSAAAQRNDTICAVRPCPELRPESTLRLHVIAVAETTGVRSVQFVRARRLPRLPYVFCIRRRLQSTALSVRT